MAKHLYSPRIADVWKQVEAVLDTEEALTPHMKSVLAGVIARLEERDQQVEDALLGDLVVNNVSGSVGTVPTVQARQIGWSANFGAFTGSFTDSGRGDGTQDLAVAYGNAFDTDTVVVMFTPVFTLGGTPLGFAYRTASDKTQFVLTIAASDVTTPTPATISYMAVGF